MDSSYDRVIFYLNEQLEKLSPLLDHLHKEVSNIIEDIKIELNEILKLEFPLASEDSRKSLFIIKVSAALENTFERLICENYLHNSDVSVKLFKEVKKGRLSGFLTSVLVSYIVIFEVEKGKKLQEIFKIKSNSEIKTELENLNGVRNEIAHIAAYSEMQSFRNYKIETAATAFIYGVKSIILIDSILKGKKLDNICSALDLQLNQQN